MNNSQKKALLTGTKAKQSSVSAGKRKLLQKEATQLQQKSKIPCPSRNEKEENNNQISDSQEVIMYDSDASGVLSEPESQIPSAQPQSTEPGKNKQQENTIAYIDLASQASVSTLPDTIRIVHLVSSDPNIILAKINPISLNKCITNVCGKVISIQHLRSGGLFVTCATYEQVKLLLNVSSLKVNSSSQPAAVRAAIARNGQSVEGRIFSPELADSTPTEILEEIMNTGAIAVRRMSRNPSTNSYHIFVITFFGINRPEKIILGSSIYRVDPHVPEPARCYKCCRLGHTSNTCRSKKICGSCSQEGHDSKECSSEQPKCINCKGCHTSFSKDCPTYRKEQNICRIVTSKNVNFQEARKIYDSSQITPSPIFVNRYKNQQSMHQQAKPDPPNASSYDEFPQFVPLPRQTIPEGEKRRSSQHHSEQLTYAAASQAVSQKSSQAPLPHLPPSNISSISYITPGQVTPEHYPQSQRYFSSMNSQNSESSSISLTPLPPFPSPTPPPSSQVPLLQNAIPEILINWLTSLLPILLKLLLSSNLSAKIQCINELGTKLNIESDISDIIASLGLTSLTSSQ